LAEADCTKVVSEPHLLGDGDHRLVADAVGAVDHRQPVARQRAFREDIEPGDPMRHVDMIPILIRGKGESWTRAIR
jgi:hypothetical protein